MKKILPPLLPALALLTLGGCATTSTLSTTENDGMYYSAAADRVTAPAPVATNVPYEEDGQGASAGDVDNPDYVAGASAAGEAEYYDDEYYYASRLRRFHSPYRGIGMGYYDFAYTDPFWYGGPALGYSPYSAWGGYGGFGGYDPFFSPWGGYGGVNINIGFGRPWGRPWGLGYGYSPFDRFGWGGYGYPGLYGGGYGLGYYGGGYGNGFYGGNGGWGTVYDRPGRTTTYGPRRARISDNPGVAAPAAGTAVNGGRRRVQEGGFTAPGTNGTVSNGVVAQPNGGSRRRVQEGGFVTPGTTGSSEAPAGRARISRDEAGRVLTTPTEQSGGRRWRVLESTTGGTGTTPGTSTRPYDYGQPTQGGRRRMDVSSGSQSGNPSGTQSGTQSRVVDQSRRQRSSTPSPARTYSAPERTYSPPTRSEPSRSSSSFGGGDSGGGRSSGGGGSMGGGGGGGRRR